MYWWWGLGGCVILGVSQDGNLNAIKTHRLLLWSDLVSSFWGRLNVHACSSIYPMRRIVLPSFEAYACGVTNFAWNQSRNSQVVWASHATISLWHSETIRFLLLAGSHVLPSGLSVTAFYWSFPFQILHVLPTCGETNVATCETPWNPKVSVSWAFQSPNSGV